MARRKLLAAVFGVILCWPACAAMAEVDQPSQDSQDSQNAAAEEMPAPPERQPRKEKLARIWANEPPLVRLARDKFGDEFTENDAKFFAAVAANEWADFRPSSDTKYDTEVADDWKDAPVLKADRIDWMCSEPSASRLVPTQGMFLKGAKIVGRIDLYRASVPFSLTFNQCLLDDGIRIRNAKLQEFTITDCCCNARFDARGVQVAENAYMMRTTVVGGMDFIEAQIGGDLDMDGGVAFHGTTPEDAQKAGVAIDLYDAKIDGDIKLGENFRGLGLVRITGTRIGRSLNCTRGMFAGLGESAIDADRAQIGRNVSLTSARAIGCVNIRRAHIGGDLECGGANLSGGKYAALFAELVDIGGQVQLGNGLHAEGEVRFVNAVIAKDVDCDNGHFINPAGSALNFDSSVIGRSLQIGYDNAAASEQNTDLQAGFVARGAVRLYSTQINQDLLASGGQFETPEGTAIVATNLRVANRMVLSWAQVKGMVDLSSADIEHELDIRASQFDGTKAYNRIAIWANGMKVHGHFNSHQVDTPEQVWPFRVDGQASFNFATIGMAWNLYGAQFHNPNGDAFDASDCHVGSYVNLDQVELDGRVSFSRAKIDGMFILTHVIKPEQTILDMRFAHVWVIKDEKLDDWPPAGQLQLEGFVYDHFDDDSPLSVYDRLAWLRRQYAPTATGAKSPDASATAGRGPTERDVAEAIAKSSADDLNAALEEGFITPVDFETVQSVEAPTMPTPMPDPQLESPSEPAFQPEPSSAGPPVDALAPTPPTQDASSDSTSPIAESSEPDTSSTPHMADPTEVTEPTDGAETSEVAAAPVQPPVPPDPAGRRYITQPYTQLASVYRAIGQDEQANTVLIARAERLGELSPALSAQGLWYRYFGRLIGFGYEPFRAIKIGAAIVLIGTVIFAIGARRNLMSETKLAEHVLSQENEAGVVSPTYPRFNPFVYSLDVFLPFADLHQRCYWIPGERPTKPRTSRNCLMHIGPIRVKWSGVLRSYLWFQTLAGWTLCTLLAAAVTGIVQS